MAKQVGTKFAWVIKNFSALKCKKWYSVPVQIGDCKWRLGAYSRGSTVSDMSLFLEVADIESLPCGWRRYVKLQLTVVQQVSVEHSVVKALCSNGMNEILQKHIWLDQKDSHWGYPSMIPLAKLHNQNEGFLVNGELIIVAEIDVLQVIGTSEEFVETNPLSKLKVESASSISESHQDIAEEFRAKNQHLKTACMNVLLSLTQTLCQTPQELSIDDLVEADNALAHMKNSGFKVDWLEMKLEEVKEKKKIELSG